MGREEFLNPLEQIREKKEFLSSKSLQMRLVTVMLNSFSSFRIGVKLGMKVIRRISGLFDGKKRICF